MCRIVELLIFAFLLEATVAHIRLRGPPQRSSIWRDPTFSNLNPEKNYDDWSLNCGAVHQGPDFSNCGLCGDPLSAPKPRDNESGGKYGQGIIAGRYKAGQTIKINVDVYPTHLGYFEIHLCDRVPESEDCFRKLFFEDGEQRYPVRSNMSKNFNTSVKLDKQVRCEKCVLRVQYLAGNNWGNCPNGTSGVGCGFQEAFRNCADITIS